MTVKRALGTAPIWLVALLGVTITALGVLVQAGTSERMAIMFAGTVSALGGAIVGAAVSLYIAAGDGRDTLRSIRELLAESLPAKVTSVESDLARLRKPWHVYHQTRFGGAIVWRYTFYPFDRDRAVGSVSAFVTEPEFDREPVYRAEAAVRGHRMFYIETAQEGNEPPTIGVLPSFAGPYQTAFAGLRVFVSWDGPPMVAKCLWSEQPLVRVTGSTVEQDDWPELEARWRNGFGHEVVLE